MSRVIGPGRRGPRVQLLQERLAGLGFYAGPVDGHYGPLTLEAVRRLQRAFRLPDDGMAGAQVWSVVDDPLLPAGMGEKGPGRPLARLVLGLADLQGSAPAEGRLPGQRLLSGWVMPWLEVARDPSGHAEPVLPAGRVAGEVAPGSAGDGAEAAVPLRVWAVTVRPARGRRFWRSALELLLHECRRGARKGRAEPVLLSLAGALPPGPVGVSSSVGQGGVSRNSSGGAGPPDALIRLALGLARAGNRVWLSLPPLAGLSPIAAYWRGHHLGRLSAPVERLVVWTLPPTPQQPLPELAALKAWLRGLRMTRAPWRTLLGVDLAAWLFEPAADSRPPAAHRLTYREAVLWAWRLRLRRLAGSQPELLPVLVRRDPGSLRRLLLTVTWSGLGGAVAAGLAEADGASLATLTQTLPPLLVSTSRISIGGKPGEGGADGDSQDPGGTGGAGAPPGGTHG